MKTETPPMYITKDLDEIAAFEMIGIMPEDYHHDGKMMFVEFVATPELQQARKDFDLHRLLESASRPTRWCATTNVWTLT